MRPLGPRRRTDDVVVEGVDDEILVYDLRRHRVHALGKTAAAIWQACDGRTTLAGISRRALPGAAPLDEGIVRLTLARLTKAHLLDEPVALTADGERSSRRELLRKAAAIGGLAVLTIHVPTAAYTQTCIPAGQCGNGGVNNQCVDRDGRRCCSGSCEQQGQTCGVGNFGRRCV